MADAAGYLPPVVARLVGDATNLIRVLEDAKARLADFAKDTFNVRVGADDAPLMVDLRGANAELIDFSRKTYNVTIGADTAPAMADLLKLRAEIDALKATRMSVTKGTLAGGALGRLFGTGGHGVLGGLLWGNTGGGFISRLLSPLTAIGTMFSAGFGSIGSLAGFGPEHLAMTLAGLVGSAGEATAGAGLLGVGSLGKMMVGGGSDMLATATARNAVGQYKTLAQTIAEFGANSAQAKDQANLLAFSLRGDSKAAQQAAAGVATASGALVTKWHAASSGAQQQADKLMRSVLDLASAFAGRVAKAAQANLSIINSGLKPLFAWLKGPGGVGVFNTLEGVFKRDLPTAVQAFDKGIELLLRTMALIAPKTGGFIKFLDNLFTRMNTTSGFAKWSKEVNRLIGDFRMWESFIKTLGHDLHSLFKDDAGEPAAIVEGLTKALQKLGKWEDSTAGKSSIGAVFTSHKQEILELGKAIGSFGESLGKIYLKAAPAFVTAVSKMLSMINPFLARMAKNPTGAWIIGLTLLGARFGLFHGILSGVGSMFASMAGKGVKALASLVPKLGAAAAGMLGLGVATDAEAGAEDVAAASAGILNIALGVGILGAVIALGVGIYELVTHWKTVWAAIVKITKDVWNWLKSAFSAVLRFLVGIWHDITSAFIDGWDHVKSWTMDAVHAVVGFFQNLWSDVSRIATDIWHDVVRFFENLWRDVSSGVSSGVRKVVNFFRNLWHDVSSAVSGMVRAVVNFFKNLWHDVTSGVSNGISSVVNWFKGLPGKILRGIGDLGSLLINAGADLLHGLIKGVESMVGGVIHSVTSAISSAYHSVLHFFGISSPSKKFRDGVGVPIAQGIAVGITRGMPLVSGALKNLTGLASSPNLTLSGGTSNPLARVEGLLTQLLAESRKSGDLARQTADNTKNTASGVKGLSSPAGVQAQLRRANGQLMTALRAGVA